MLTLLAYVFKYVLQPNNLIKSTQPVGLGAFDTLSVALPCTE